MISKKYKEVIKNLEENIDSKRDLEYAKKQIADLTVLYIDELTKIIEKFDKKIQGFDNTFTGNIQKNGMSDTQLYKQSGNAVSPPVITEIINNLMEFTNE